MLRFRKILGRNNDCLFDVFLGKHEFPAWGCNGCARKPFMTSKDVRYWHSAEEGNMRQRQNRYLGATGNGDTSRDSVRPFPLREAPANGAEKTERIERLVERIVEEHRETIDKLADE